MNTNLTSSFSFLVSYRFLLLILFLGFISCENEEQFSHPVVHTGEVTDISIEGAMFHGRCVNSSEMEVVDHGFVWDTKPEPGIKNSLKHSLGSLEGNNFNAIVQSGFFKGREYYMRAFVKTNDEIIYGREVKFISQGGKPIEVSTFEPSEAFFGDTIQISGRNLQAKPNDISVKFNEEKAEVIYITNDKIKVIVPNQLYDVSSQISLTIISQTHTFNESFRLLPPLIKYIEPDIGWNHTIVELKGKGFHIEKSRNKVFIDDNELEVLSSTNQKISFQPTFNIPHGKHFITVETLGQQSVSQEQFQKMEPWEKLDNPLFESNSPNGFSIGGRVFAGNIAKRELFEYIPAVNQWVKKGMVPFGSSNYKNNLFSAEDFGYLILRNWSYDTYWGRLYTYKPANDQWTRKVDFPGRVIPYQTGFTIENDLYYGAGQPQNINHTPEFWKYSYGENEWTQLNDFPFEGSTSIGFSHNNKGYMLGYHRTISKYGISEYTPETDSWEFILDLDSFSFNATTLVPLKESFLILPIYGDFYRDVFEYLPANNQFIKRGEISIRHTYLSPFFFHTNTLSFFGSTGDPEPFFWQINQNVPWEK